MDPIAVGANTLSGTAVARAGVRVYRGNTLIGSTVAGSDGRFNVVINPQPKDTALRFVFTTKAGQEEIIATVGEGAKGTDAAPYAGDRKNRRLPPRPFIGQYERTGQSRAIAG